jgi:hypothetical protein
MRRSGAVVTVALTWFEADDLLPAVRKALEPVAVVLDVGCGIMPQPYLRPLVHICCEPFDQYVRVLQEKVRGQADRTFVVLKASWSAALELFPPHSVDTVFLVDVIEHLEKEEGRRLLAATEGLARRQVVIFTPLGFMAQHHSDGKDAWGLEGGAWQEHKSGWGPEDFDLSWQIYAAKVFHTTDNVGRPLEKPFGALWAVKTMAGAGGPGRAASFALRQIHRLLGRLYGVGERHQ